MWRMGVFICALAVGQAAAEDIAAGRLLVASEKLGDPNFAESVILVVQHDEAEGTVGLILNRRSDLPLSKLFPDVKGAKSDPVYVGGPVGKGAAQALLRLPAKEEGARRVIGDVYLTGDKALVEKSVASGADPSRFRVYAGYAGWAPGQLEMEIELGAWTVMRAGPGVVFDDDPESLWMRMSRESQKMVAQARRNNQIW
jgi:putative transcriptional regulator